MAAYTSPTSVALAAAGSAIALGLALPPLPVTAWPLLMVGFLVLFQILGYGAHWAIRPQRAWAGLLGLALLGMALRYPSLEKFGRARLTDWRDHAALSSFPAIFPQRVWDDHPQRFFLWAPNSQQMQAYWSNSGDDLGVQSLGGGLFRLDYDPRRQSGPTDESGKASLRLTSDQDGERTLPLESYHGRTRPSELCSDWKAGLAATVSESSDEAIVFDRLGLDRRYRVENGPSGCLLVDRARSLLVAHRYGKSLIRLDLSSGQSTGRTLLGGMPERMTLSPDGKVVAILCEDIRPSLVLVDSRDLSVKSRLELPQMGEYLCFGRNSEELVISSRRGRCLMHVERGALTQTKALARPATGLCLAGGKVFFTSTSPQLRADDQRGNHYIQNSLLSLDLASWNFREVRSTESRTGRQQAPGQIDSGCDAAGLTVDSRGNLLIAFTGTHEIAIYPTGEGLISKVDLSGHDLFCPTSAVDMGDNTTLVSLPAQGALAWLDASLTLQHVVWLSFKDEELRTSQPAAWQRRQGEISFYEATVSGISCQSCHTRGDSDYARHDIGAGNLWGTLTCRGVAATGPYLRNGDYPDLADLHATAEVVYHGYRRAAPAPRALALKAYVESLPAAVNPRQLVKDLVGLAAERRGFAAFRKAGCVSCHTPPAFTNLAMVGRAQLFPSDPSELGSRRAVAEDTSSFEFLDVPSLRGVWASAPFLHDNRAKTLREVLRDQNHSNQHGDTASLSELEASDLQLFFGVAVKARILLLCVLLVSLVGAACVKEPLTAVRGVAVARWTGYGAFFLLFLSQAISPLARLKGGGKVLGLRSRRDFGIAAAFLVSIHAGLQIYFYLPTSLGTLLADHTWLQFGAVSWTLLLLLWITSYPALVRALRWRLWKPLHRLSYAAFVLAWLHLATGPWSDRRLGLALGIACGLLWLGRCNLEPTVVDLEKTRE